MNTYSIFFDFHTMELFFSAIHDEIECTGMIMELMFYVAERRFV